MAEEKRKRDEKTGYDLETVTAVGTPPDPESPFYDAQLRQESARKEMLRDRAARYAEVNPPINSMGQAAAHPRVFEPYLIIERSEALDLLGIESAELSKLLRRGVVRKAHPSAWAGLVYNDVALLASAAAGTPARADLETRLRMQNIDAYLSAFSPSAYYEMNGDPKPASSMDALDREAGYAYQEGLLDLPAKFRSIMRPVPHSQSKDHKAAHDVQFLYLADEDSPQMTTALMMRRWYRETHLQARYHVARVAIPPLAALGRPEHEGVLRFLIESASILHQIDFEAIPQQFYDRITDIDMKMGEGSNLPGLYTNLTGAQISTEEDLNALLGTQDSTAALPLRYQVAAWYQAYSNLMGGGEAPLFTIKRVKYIDSLVHTMTNTTAADYDAATVSSLRRKVESVIGCTPEIAVMYRPEHPPLYVGEPPSYWEASGNRRMNKALLGSRMPYNVEILMAANSLADAGSGRLQASRKLNLTLPEFHRKVSMMMPPTTKVRQDKLVVSKLFASLTSHGIDPVSMYLYPYRDAESLVVGLNGKLKAVLGEMAAYLTAGADRGPTDGLLDMPMLQGVPDMLLSDITDDIRSDHAYEFAIKAMGFTSSDLEGMVPEDILEGLPDTEALDEYIIKVAGEGLPDEAETVDIGLTESLEESRKTSEMIDLDSEAESIDLEA